VAISDDTQELTLDPFAPGNERMTPPEILAVRKDGAGTHWDVRVVPNKFPALGIDTDLHRQAEGMYDRMTGFGAHEVIIDTPDKNKRWHELDIERLSLCLCQST